MTEVPVWAQLSGGDNRPVLVPAWLAREILKIVEEHNQGKSKPRTPCYAAEYQDREDDLRQLIGCLDE